MVRSLLRGVMELEMYLDGHGCVRQGQGNRLVFLMVRVRQEHRRQPVEGDLPVGLGIFDRPCVVLARNLLVVGLMAEGPWHAEADLVQPQRSEEHTSELQSLMRSSYAVFCLKKKNKHKIH